MPSRVGNLMWLVPAASPLSLKRSKFIAPQPYFFSRLAAGRTPSAQVDPYSIRRRPEMPRPDPSRNPFTTRRTFVSAGAAALTAGFSGVVPDGAFADTSSPNMLGPLSGYSPQIGTFVSQLTWMREMNGVLRSTEKLTQADLDYLFDKNANTIGPLMLHLAATETYYQRNTFDGMKWGSWSGEIKKKWDAAMNLGDAGRASIKG